MMRYWTHFAATGDPNSDGLPVWPPFADDTEDLLDLVSAICEYVFLFGRRFEQFMERRNARQKQQAGRATAAKPQAVAAGAKTK